MLSDLWEMIWAWDELLANVLGVGLFVVLGVLLIGAGLSWIARRQM